MLLAAAAMVAVGAQAQAQAAAPDASAKPAPAKPAAKTPAKPSAGKTVDAITVTGASQNGMRTSIDRRSYGVANDLATTTGSISDALKNIPSVEVDVQGNVSLRGDTNVTIMVDGKPSALFRGASAAQALQSMPADQIERVEVITNPSAQFSPEGTAGVINLITKTSHHVGKSGSIRLNLGTGNRGNFGVSGAYNSNKLTLSGDLNGRFDPQSGDGLDNRQILDGHGHLLGSSHDRDHQAGRATSTAGSRTPASTTISIPKPGSAATPASAISTSTRSSRTRLPGRRTRPAPPPRPSTSRRLTWEARRPAGSGDPAADLRRRPYPDREPLAGAHRRRARPDLGVHDLISEPAAGPDFFSRPAQRSPTGRT